MRPPTTNWWKELSLTRKHSLIVENQVIMFAKNNNSVKFGDDRELATFPTLPNLVSVENDATLAKSATAVGYAHKRKIEQMTRCIIINTNMIILTLIIMIIIVIII